jgi:predicted nuclease of predicted toxin-antitoxin system
MKFLVDAQLPRRLCFWLRQQGHDAVHTLDLDLGNRTPDADIIHIADQDERIVVTKDADFVQSFLLRNTPERLLLIASGNVGNAELERLLAVALPEILDAFDCARYVELSKKSLIIHE